jgi:pyrroloquinoline quinone biosynthesis protein E
MSEAPRPYTLIAELTYRCPLHCVYCSNPVELEKHSREMTTDDWLRVLDEAADLGIVQVHFTGGEPLARSDLEALVARAKERDLYSNLVTSGIPLTEERLRRIKDNGIDHVQLSFQGADRESSLAIAGYDAFEKKLEIAKLVKRLDLPLTVNVVMHRQNLDAVLAIIALAENLGADRLELANTQYHGFAFENRNALMPSLDQLNRAQAIALSAKERLKEKMEILFVKPDYFSSTPRACMDGWARRFLQVIPDGTVVPCHAATTITDLKFERVTESSLRNIWEDSPAMNAYRGDAWMQEPCKSCDKRTVDFGGCRCQAFALTGDAAATDPACTLSSRHPVILRAKRDAATPLETAGESPHYIYRGR